MAKSKTTLRIQHLVIEAEGEENIDAALKLLGSVVGGIVAGALPPAEIPALPEPQPKRIKGPESKEDAA